MGFTYRENDKLDAGIDDRYVCCRLRRFPAPECERWTDNKLKRDKSNEGALS